MKNKGIIGLSLLLSMLTLGACGNDRPSNSSSNSLSSSLEDSSMSENSSTIEDRSNKENSSVLEENK